ncbi:MAG TPA: hypothetical protein PK264_04540 [Hyphomicrobiaceae bacterium]|nr:hypothetical protein [Hyphomicrobiaceae bacterium]
MHAQDVTLALFTAVNLIRVFSYLPQIRCIARDTTGATCISYTTWAMWVLGHATTLLYAIVNLGDPVLATVSTINMTCCLTVIALTAWKRRVVAMAGSIAA